MRNGYTVWSLNAAKRIVDRDQRKLLGELDRKPFLSDSEFGDRRNFLSDDQYACNKYPHNLMCEMPKAMDGRQDGNSDCDEYFFPIIPKSIGLLADPLYRRAYSELDNTDEVILKKIADQAVDFNDAAGPNRSMLSNEWISDNWSKPWGPRGRIGMASLEGMGYYEMLLRTAIENDRPNVLVAYSQGATVARFLAYLDEYVFKANCIKAIVTVQGANYGSPVASDRNAQNVLKELKKIMAGLADKGYLPFTKEFIESMTLRSIADYLNKFNAEFDYLPDSKLGPVHEMTITARKWMTGLYHDTTTAFLDLAPENIEREGSVLWCINKFPLKRVKYGAVIANDDEPFNNSLLLNLAGKFVFKDDFKSLISAISVPYKRLMNEKEWSATQLAKDKGRVNLTEGNSRNLIYLSGVEGVANSGFQKNRDIGKSVHDFIIPSVYQMLPDSWVTKEKDNFLGQCLNRYANHMDGSKPNTKAGKTNFYMVVDLLKNVG